MTLSPDAPPAAPPAALRAGFPTAAADITPAVMTALLQTLNGEVDVTAVEVRKAWTYGSGEKVSTAGRLDLDLSYAGPPNGPATGSGATSLPAQVVLKINLVELPVAPLYRNEVAAYTRLRPWEVTRTPRCFGGYFDEATGSFGLALEDLTTQGASFPSALDHVGIESLESLLTSVAALHRRNWGADADWQSPQLSWAQSHTEGELHDLFFAPDLVPLVIEDQVATWQHKRELCQMVGETPASLNQKVMALQRHQARLPQTLCHGDLHVGNTYLLPDRSMGVLDWQLSSRGYYMHDVAYAVVTALDVATRRAEERRLVELHRRELVRLGATDVPTEQEAFDEYRRAVAWGAYIGWLTTPVDNYGWQVNVANHLRLFTAYRDLDTARAIEDVS